MGHTEPYPKIPDGHKLRINNTNPLATFIASQWILVICYLTNTPWSVSIVIDIIRQFENTASVQEFLAHWLQPINHRKVPL